MLTIYGVYLPYHNGTASQVALYSETLSDLQTLLGVNEQSPIMVVSESNAALPKHCYLKKNWYKSQPFNKHSVLLYDFLCNNDLFIADFAYKQLIRKHQIRPT